MNQMIVQLGERLFEGYVSNQMSKGELMGRARGMGLSPSVLGHLDRLPEGQVSKQQVHQHLAKAQGSSLERDILKML